MAVAAYDHPVAEHQHRLGAQVEVRHHPGGEGDLLADDAVPAEPDPPLAEDGALREGEAGAVPDRTEPEPPRGLRGDRTGLLHPAPAGVDHAARQPAARGRQR